MYAEPTQKKCKKCEITKPADQFYLTMPRGKKGKRHLRPLCRKCERIRHDEYVEKHRDRLNKQRVDNYHAGDKSKSRQQSFRRKYGFSLEKYNAMFAEQNGTCLICKRHQSELKHKLCVDHDHVTKKIRGLLCKACNRGIGFLQDNPDFMMIAAQYLKSRK